MVVEILLSCGESVVAEVGDNSSTLESVSHYLMVGPDPFVIVDEVESGRGAALRRSAIIAVGD